MAVGGGLPVDGAPQVQHADDAVRAEVEALHHLMAELLVGAHTGAEGVHLYADGFGHADGVGQRHLGAPGQPLGHQVLGDVPGGIAGGAVYLGGVLAAERAPAVPRVAAIGIHDDLAAGQARIRRRTAQHEAAGGVDIDLGARGPQPGGHRLADDRVQKRLFKLRPLHAFVVLSGEYHRIHGYGRAILIDDRDLALAVRTQPGQHALLAHLRQPAREAVCQRNGQGHPLRRFVAGKAEHHALIACAGAALAGLAGFQGVVYAHGDIRALRVYGGEHRTAVRAEAKACIHIADVAQNLPRDFVDRHIGGGGDFAHDLHKTRGCAGFARHARHGVAGQQRVKHRVADLVAYLIGMPLGDGFAGKKGSHAGILLPDTSGPEGAGQRTRRAGRKKRACGHCRRERGVFLPYLPAYARCGICHHASLPVGGCHRARPSTALYKVFGCQCYCMGFCGPRQSPQQKNFRRFTTACPPTEEASRQGNLSRPRQTAARPRRRPPA